MRAFSILLSSVVLNGSLAASQAPPAVARTDPVRFVVLGDKRHRPETAV
jgi:hypothetical protein